MAQKPSIPKGMRDFDPQTMVKRNYIFDTIKSVFKRFGYLPIETPAMENLTTLLGKYGEEGDKLLFKVLNSGDFLAGVDTSTDNLFAQKMATKISEKGLRYDLTVPFARFVVQYRNDIVFPFKRYQMQPVWRADRPQKGRYREFYQCDVDVVGSDSLLNEAELVQIVDDVFKQLKINVIVKINNRKILSGIAEYIGATERLTDITVAIDKLDKIGIEAVNNELIEKGLSVESIDLLQPVLFMTGNSREKIEKLKLLIGQTETGLKGIDEITILFNYLDFFNLNLGFELDLTLARGLNYYTGAIFEVKSKDASMGSICGGGRYDDLTGIFGMPGVSGVGISFGADRIFDVMTELSLFPTGTSETTLALFVNFGKFEELYCLPFVQQLRDDGLNTEIYPDHEKMKKQIKYADQKKIPYVIIAGENEIEHNQFTIKRMSTGEQFTVKNTEIVHILKELAAN
ncbi:MAG: histidine--tRNA ligase [Bacteroidales bacterium]|nr:histidine--tRNA ligase [Bacteroidales bacterium]